jgi:hypothetical protein
LIHSASIKNPNGSYSDGLQRLIRANEPYWGGEAEVIRTYWHWSERTVETDRKWLIHQIYKEYWDGILPPLEALQRALPGASTKSGRHRLLTVAEVLHEEVEHFAMFADLYRELEGEDYALSPEELKQRGRWLENDRLMELRRRHAEASPDLGRRAYQFTEGGYCALFAEGMALGGGGSIDAAIAEVCRRIYEDEFNHMLLGIIQGDDVQLSDSDWDTLVEYTVEQMKMRILMRNAQFSEAVPPHRLEQLLNGEADPIPFDYEAAEKLLAAGT